MRKLFTSGDLLLGAPTESWDPSALDQGLCAIQFCGMWAMPVMQEALGDDLGVFPFPKAATPAQAAVYNGGWSMFVNAKGKNVDRPRST